MQKLFVGLFITSLLMQSCKKTQEEFRPYSSVTVVNATTDVANARAYVSENDIPWKRLPATDAAAQYRSTQLSAFATQNKVRAVSGADTTIVLFNSVKGETLAEKGFNTLFLCGSTGAYEGIFVNNDNIVNHKDSIFGIRFINLSPNSSPVNITLSTTPTTNEATGLAYKQKTDFRTYPALSSTPAMDFQVRDAAGTVLANYTLPITPVSPYTTAGIPFARFRNITLVIKGLEGTTSGANAFGIFPVSHY